MKKYRKKPVIVEAVQWTGENHAEMCEFIDPEAFEIISRVGLVIHTLEGDHHASPGDYIVKGIAGEFYPCKPDIFMQTYEPVKECMGGGPAMTDINKALLGDHEAAKRLTDAGVMLPCPMCGGNPVREAPNMHGKTTVTCTQCGLTTRWGWHYDVSLAWNARALILSAEEMEILEGME